MKILVHTCCGPCLLPVARKLLGDGHHLTAYFYNPNIHPRAEHELRLEAFRRAAQALQLTTLPVPEYDPQTFFRAVTGGTGRLRPPVGAGFHPGPLLRADPEIGPYTAREGGLNPCDRLRACPEQREGAASVPQGDRCPLCYRMRLFAAALAARDAGIEAFTTTLLVSPHQDQERIREAAEAAAHSADVHFHFEDFRPLFAQVRELAQPLGLYRQKYCGCLYSEIEAERSRRDRRERRHAGA